MEILGVYDPAFQTVVDVFEQGFDEGRDVGAALTIFAGDQPVVDVWAGHRDRKKTTPWASDTLCCVFSISKAITTYCLLQAIDRGHIQLDEPVTTYWPNFGQNGKDKITIRQIMSHQAGLAGFHDAVNKEDFYKWSAITQHLEKETPWWLPGAAHGYHARTFGFLLGEILRRASGKSIGDWVREEFCVSYDLDFFIGLPEQEHRRCADMIPARIRPGAQSNLSPDAQLMMKEFGDLSTVTGAAFQNPRLGAGFMNSAQFRSAEIPAVNGHGTARSVAKILSLTGELISKDLLKEALLTQSLGKDKVLKSLTHFGLGFMLHHPEAPIGCVEGSFGHAGAGGAMAFRDPERDISFAFVMNQMQEGVVTGGKSATAVAEALYQVL